MTSQPFARKQVYLGGFQRHIAARLTCLWMVYHALMWHCMFFMDYIASQTVFATGGERVPLLDLYQSFAGQNWTLLMWAGAVGPFMIWQIVRLTHRVAGPIWRMENVLQRMANGETISQIGFRKGDLLPGLEKAFNAYLASLSASQANSACDPCDQPAPHSAPSVPSYQLAVGSDAEHRAEGSLTSARGGMGTNRADRLERMLS